MPLPAEFPQAAEEIPETGQAARDLRGRAEIGGTGEQVHEEKRQQIEAGGEKKDPKEDGRPFQAAAIFLSRYN